MTLARAGVEVELFEGAESFGGGCRTAQLTLPGYAHDVCSAVHPLAAAAPFFDGIELPLLTPRVAFAHPLDGGRAAAVFGSVDDTAQALRDDRRSYRRLLGPLVKRSERIVPNALGPVRPWPLPPPAMALFGVLGAQPASVLAGMMRGEEARALLAGCAAHSMRPLRAPLTGGFGLLMTMLAHQVGWPVVAGGSSGIVRALVNELERRGAKLHAGHVVESLAELPPSRMTLLDVTPRQLLALDDGRLQSRYRRALGRYQYGPGIFKLDWALSGPVPWTAEICRETVTVHVGGSFEEVARSESDVWSERESEHPFCIVVQPSVVDSSRAPAGHHTLWGYCHVPNGSTYDMTERIEAQIERFAPGLPRPDPRARDRRPRRCRGAQPELRRRRHRCRREHDPPDDLSPDARTALLSNAGSGAVSLLSRYSARRRRARDVRDARGARRARRSGRRASCLTSPAEGLA